MRWKLKWAARALAALAILLSTATCVIRLAWFETTRHPAGETWTSVTVEEGSIELLWWESRANASPTLVRQSILNRQLQIGFTPRWSLEWGSTRVRAQIPLALCVAIGVLVGGFVVAAARLGRRSQREVCPCGYSRAGLRDQSPCPECGRVDPAAVRK